jgi:hypothetical protein
MVVATGTAAFPLTPTPTATPGVEPCLGDCGDDGRVTVEEMVTCVTVVLGIRPSASCTRCPATIAELIAAVHNALAGCRNTPAGRCREAADCNPSSHLCLEPGGFAGCGICYPDLFIDQTYHRCAADSACAEGDICEYLGTPLGTCAPCEGPVAVCVPGCRSDIDCDAAQACVLGRCVGRPCTGQRDCPGQYECPGDDEGGMRCVWRPCSSDAECPGGMCVNGTCHTELGRCTLYPS